MTQKFCNFLSNQYHVTYDVVKPCCWIKNTESSISNTEEIKEQFSRLSKVTDWIPECSHCKTLEDQGVASPRLSSFNEKVFSENDQVGEPIKIEVQINDDCNAACLMCSSWNSTTWQQYTAKTVKEVELHFKHSIPVDTRFESVKNIIDFTKVKQIHFFGGEPFKTDTHKRVLKEVPDPSLVNLVYVTNGSIYPEPDVLELLNKFKHVNVVISIDGIDEHFNYLRWPLQWKQVKKNILEYAQLPANKFKIDTSFIATPFNMFYQDRYKAWAVEFFKDIEFDYSGWFNYPHPVMGIINLSCVPPELQQALLSKYGTDARIARLSLPFDTNKFTTFIKYVEHHDKHRQLNWRGTFPEVFEYFKDYL